MVLAELIRLLGGSKKASQRLGISQRTAQRWASGKQKPSKKNLPRAEELWREVVTPEWSEEEKELFDHLLENNRDAHFDRQLEDLFDEAFFRRGVSREDRNSAYMELNEYLADEYGIDFDDVFEWENYREWYDAQAAA